MTLVIFLTNVPIRKRKGMKKMIRIENKHTKEKEPIFFFKKRFCTKEDKTSSNEDEFSESDTKTVLFMTVEDSKEEFSEEEYEEVEFAYKEDFLSAIELIKQEKRKNKSLQEELDKRGVQNSDFQELEKMITK
jgi:hypothetical protein